MNHIKQVYISVFLVICSSIVLHAQNADALPHYNINGAREGTWRIALGSNLADTVAFNSGDKAFEAVVHFQEGKPVDSAYYFYPNGQLFWKGVLMSFTPFLPVDGKQTFYRDNGMKLRETCYRNGKKHGVENMWNQYGARESETPYMNGVRHGTSRHWGPTGMLSYTGEWKNGTCISSMSYPGEREGQHYKHYDDTESGYRYQIEYSSGIRKSIMVSDGGRGIDVSELGSFGNELSVDALLNSKDINYGKQYSYYHGIKGFEIHSDRTGRCRIELSWNKNGLMRREVMSSDCGMEGVNTIWYKNGIANSRIEYKKGKKHGTARWWYLNGRKKAEIEYKNNRITGTPTYWDENGNPVMSIEGFKPD